MARLPSGGYYGPLAQKRIELGPNQEIRVDSLSQNVPGYAPAGSYLYLGFVGVYPDSVADSSYFEVTKMEGQASSAVFDWAWHGRMVDTAELPVTTSLTRVYPNPFNAQITLEYQLEAAGEVELDLFDVLGRRVVDLVNENKSAGRHSFIFDVSELPSGVYFCRLTTAEGRETKRVTLLK